MMPRLLVTSAATAATVIAATAATTAASTSTTTAAFLRLEAVAAEDRTIAPGLERHGGLLAAAGADYRGSGAGSAGAIATTTAAAVSTTAATSLIGLLGLSTWLAALGRRVSPFLEESLVSSRKSKFPPAVATG
jgi:hypothetical protein